MGKGHGEKQLGGKIDANRLKQASEQHGPIPVAGKLDNGGEFQAPSPQQQTSPVARAMGGVELEVTSNVCRRSAEDDLCPAP